MSEWQPIETAPRSHSGTVHNLIYLLLWDKEAFRPYVGWWTEQSGWIDEEGDDCEPTHWMPLPEPPKGGGQ